MNYQQQTLRSQLYRALKQAGARPVPVQRQEADPNGVPQGDPRITGCLYGIDYLSQNAGGGLHIDLPGIVLGGENTRRFAALLQQGEAPRQGDRLMLDAQGTEILRADCQLGVMYLLTLAE